MRAVTHRPSAKAPLLARRPFAWCHQVGLLHTAYGVLGSAAQLAFGRLDFAADCPRTVQANFHTAKNQTAQSVLERKGSYAQGFQPIYNLMTWWACAATATVAAW